MTNIDSVGLGTFRDGIDCNGDLDVDGHTNLDNVSIAGVSTFSGIVAAGIGSTAITLGNNHKITLGSAHELELHHDGSNSYIKQRFFAYPSRLKIISENSGIDIMSGSGGNNHGAYENAISCENNGAIKIYHAGVGPYFETYGAGVKFQGSIQVGYDIFHHGDTDTRIRFPTLDTISFETAGSERLRIDSSGRVLIGTDSSLNQYGSQSHLQVAGTSYDSSTIALRREQNNANPPGIVFAKSRSGTLGGNTIVQDNDQIGSLIFTAADGNDLTTVGAQIKVEVDGTPASNNIPGRIVFQTGGTNERLRIASNGTIGIGGTTIPGALLDLSAAVPAILFSETGVSANNGKWLNAANASELYWQAQTDAHSGGGNLFKMTRSNQEIQSFEGQQAGVTWFTVRNSNKTVGIGTDNPADILHLQSTAPILKVDATNNQSGLRVDILGQTGGSNNQLFRVQRDATTKFQINDDGDVVITGDDNAELKLKAGTTTGNGVIAFLNSSGSTKGNIFYDTDDNFMVFKTNGTASSNERLRITSGGNIGMGVQGHDPLTRLHIQDSNNGALKDVLTITNENGSAGTEVGMVFECGVDEIARISAKNEGSDIGPLIFSTASSTNANPTEKLRITRYGELGLSGTNYGTAGQVLTSGGSGQPVEWRTIVQAPVITNISGSIVANLSGTTLTLTGQGFIASAQGVVNFSGGSLNPSKNVNATPSSSTTLTVTVPSDVANNVNSGETITIKFTTSAGLISSGINTTVIAAPSGGSITTSGNYRIHTFTSSSNFVLTKSIACEYLVVAGGGAGGANDGGQDFSGGSGGGGAGGYRTGTITPSANTHAVTVGGGGAGNNSAAAGGDGGNSAFGSIVSGGGGGGAGVNNAGSNGRNGGSGGGAGGDDGSTLFTGGSGTSGQGNNGGNAGGSNSNAGGGGGGGAGAVGETAANGFAGGDGGTGVVNSINGSSAVWAGGGGGSVGAGGDKGLGGPGGGGAGAARNLSNAVAGISNTGGGGGGGADSNVTSQKAGANGGSGIVIVRYDITNL